MADDERILTEAAGLMPYEAGVHPEYQRGIAELTNRLLGRTSDDLELTAERIRVRQPAKPLVRITVSEVQPGDRLAAKRGGPLMTVDRIDSGAAGYVYISFRDGRRVEIRQDLKVWREVRP